MAYQWVDTIGNDAQSARTGAPPRFGAEVKARRQVPGAHWCALLHRGQRHRGWGGWHEDDAADCRVRSSHHRSGARRQRSGGRRHQQRHEPGGASAASCSSSIPRAVQTAATIYGVGSGGCSGYSSSLTVEVRESRGAGYAVVARAGCIAAANRSCTAITTRVTKRPGARYTVYQIGASPRF